MAEINVHEALLLVLHHIRSPNSNNAELEIVRMAERVFEDYASRKAGLPTRGR
jgi:hypothetical protein